MWLLAVLSHSHFRSPECSKEIAKVFSFGKIVPTWSLKRRSELKRELKDRAIDYILRKVSRIELNIIIVGRRVAIYITLKCPQNSVREGSEDFSTLKMCFIIVLISFVVSALLSLLIDCVGFYGEQEKNPLLIVNIVCHSSTASWTFFPTNGSSFIRFLEQTHIFFLSTKKVKRE